MKYFAYGMNTNLNEMARRCPGAVSLGPAWINDYEFAFRTHADIEHVPGAICYGVLWDIDLAALQALDALEGFPYYYSRFNVRVHTDTHFVRALVYQMNDQSGIQQPGAGYLEMVTEGYQQNAVPTNQLDHAINRICSTYPTTMEYPSTWSQMTRDYV